MNLYNEAGVDIDAANGSVLKLKALAQLTRRPGVNPDIGGFAAVLDPKELGFKDPLFIMSTDGVGTKLRIADIMRIHTTVGQDLVAMCVNDILVQGATPLAFLDYYATGKIDQQVFTDVINGIITGCRIAGCALMGGETAEMPGFYTDAEYDIAGFAIGAVERDQHITGKDVALGCAVIGLPSSGIHSNGFSLIRQICYENALMYEDFAPFDYRVKLGEVLLTPTKIYTSEVAKLKSLGVLALAHITGGGFLENIPRVIPDWAMVEIDPDSWDWLPIFRWLLRYVSPEEMIRVFNCGIGMVAIVYQHMVKDVLDQIPDAKVIGRVAERFPGDPGCVVRF